VLLKVSMSASREIDVVWLAVTSVLPSLLVPILLGGPFVLQDSSPVGRWRVTTGRRSYEGWCGGAMAIVVKASMLFGDDALF